MRDNMTSNQGAFLDMIAVSEGTSGIGDNGYNVMVGTTPSKPLLFSSYADHPRILNKQLNSTAAGRYQLLSRYYDYYKRFLDLPDFSPTSQDLIALQQIKECRAIPDIDAGHFNVAVAECAHIWASLPGSIYDQHTNSLDDLRAAYVNAGGTLASDSTTS